MRGKENTWESKTLLAARLWAVFNVIMFILSIFIQGGELPSQSVTVILNSCSTRGSQRGYAEEPCEHGSTETLWGHSNYHCMCNHKSRTITHTIRHLLSPTFLFCCSAWGAYRQLLHKLRDRHDRLDQLLWSVKGQIFHSLGSVSGLLGRSVCLADALCKGHTAVVSVIARVHTCYTYTAFLLENYLFSVHTYTVQHL